MGLRENVVNRLARVLGVDSPLSKATDSSAPITQATQLSGQLPAAWLADTYAPGWPIQPMTSMPGDGLIPREIDYPISVNATLQPRTAYGLMPFSALKEAYESVAEVRLPVSTLLREMMIFRPHLVDAEGGEIVDHDYNWLTVSPDRVTSFDVWMTRFLKSSNIFDAGAFFFEYDKGNLNGVRYVDGSTLFIMVDEHGQVPKPDQVSNDPEIRKRYLQKADAWLKKGKALPKTTPAYAQVIKGTPFGWYDQNQIWYKPRSRRFDAPYGETAIEQAWAWILIVANVTGFELAHYREGNMPEGWINAPEGWTLERIAAFEKSFNDRMSSGPAERRRSRWLPHGSEWHETKKPEFPQQLYDQAMTNISLFFGIPPSEYGKVPGSGLGGSGFADAMQSSLFRMGLLPQKIYIESAMNEVLKRAGVDDAFFNLGFPTDESSPEKHRKSIMELFSNGLITFNSALSQLGQDQIEGGDVHILLEYGTITILEEFLKNPAPIAPIADPAFVPGQEVIEPVDDEEQKPVDTQKTRKEPITKQDLELAEKMIARRSLNVKGTYYSIPEKDKAVKLHDNILHVPAHPKNPHDGKFAPKGRVVTSSQAAILAEQLGIEIPEEVDLEQWRAMVEDEANEHPSIVGDDLGVAGQIAIDHLTKGGAGSGNHGHSGRAGVRGGSGGGGGFGGGGGGFKNTKNTVVVQQTAPGKDGTGNFLIDKDGTVYSTLDSHDTTAQELGYEDVEECIDGGGVRIAYFPQETNFQTKSIDNSTLKTIQKLQDEGKITIPKGGVVWASATSDDTPAVFVSTANFLAASKVTIRGGSVILKSLAKSQDSDGVMVALDIPDDVARKLKAAVKDLLPAGSEPLPVSEMHVTLFYPGALEDLSFDQAKLIDAVKEFCRTHAPLDGVIGGMARFNGDGENKPLVALFDCPDLPQFRQELVEHLHASGIEEVLDDVHGFIPHITLAYVPADKSVPDVSLALLPLSFKEITVVWGGKWHYIPLLASHNMKKVETGDLAKHCGVCAEDDEYYGAPVAREVVFAFPDDKHKNGVEIVAIVPEDLAPRPALWKPEGGELETLQYRIGGTQYTREEAAYLLDRSLNFYLVPVAYVADINDERGVVIHYSLNTSVSKDVYDYAPMWMERVAVLDYIMGQTDRHTGNFLTHPDEPDRPILIDNGLSFPSDEIACFSPFVDAMRGKPLSSETSRFLQVCVADMATWGDIERLIGADATLLAHSRAERVLALGMIPVEADAEIDNATAD